MSICFLLLSIKLEALHSNGSFLRIGLFIFGCAGSSTLHASFLSLRCAGFPMQWLLLLPSVGPRCTRPVVAGHGPSSSLACGFFPDQGLNPCIGTWAPIHCTTRQVPSTSCLSLLLCPMTELSICGRDHNSSFSVRHLLSDSLQKKLLTDGFKGRLITSLSWNLSFFGDYRLHISDSSGELTLKYW